MKHSASLVMLALATILVSASPSAVALTLGELRGVAVIGRALDVSVQVQADTADDLAATCFGAEVFHADARQATPQISVTPGSTGDALVRVRSAALVDEPVVSVELQRRCGASTTRRYVLLADVQSAVSLPVATTAATSVTAVPASVSVAANAASAVVVANLPKASASGPMAGKPPGKKPGKPAAKNGARGANAASQAGHPANKAVLKLDPFDLFSDRIAVLDASMLFEPTADALAQARKVADLQNDVKVLRELAAKNDAQMLDLRTQLQLAQSQQMSPVWFYALLGVALAGLGALAWLLWRQRQARHLAAAPWHDSLPWPTPAATTASPQPVPLPPEPAPEPASPLNAQWYAVTPEEVPPPQVAQPKAPASNPASGLAGLHSFSIEPILDIRQQAEFFVSLGQTDRALHILMQQIAGSSAPNPFIYLDLLALLHSLGMKAEFREYRRSFNQHFSAVMPDFAAFHLDGRDLLDYPDVLVRLVQGWPSAQTLQLLSSWILRNPKATAHVSFDLAAFRDLLMLHALAEEVADDLPRDTASQPWPASAEPAHAPEMVLPVAAAVAEQPDEPPEANPQTLDMDFSMFDTGTFGLAPSTRTQPPAEPAARAEQPYARWPTKDLR